MTDEILGSLHEQADEFEQMLKQMPEETRQRFVIALMSWLQIRVLELAEGV